MCGNLLAQAACAIGYMGRENNLEEMRKANEVTWDFSPHLKGNSSKPDSVIPIHVAEEHKHIE